MTMKTITTESGTINLYPVGQGIADGQHVELGTVQLDAERDLGLTGEAAYQRFVAWTYAESTDR